RRRIAHDLTGPHVPQRLFTREFGATGLFDHRAQLSVDDRLFHVDRDPTDRGHDALETVEVDPDEVLHAHVGDLLDQRRQTLRSAHRVGGVEFDVFGSWHRLVRVLARLRVPTVTLRLVDLQVAEEGHHNDAAAVLGDVDEHDAVRASSLNVRGVADSLPRFDTHPGVRTDDQEILVVDLGFCVVDVLRAHVERGDLVELGVEPLLGAPRGCCCHEHQYGDNAGRYPQCPCRTAGTSLLGAVRTGPGGVRLPLRFRFFG